MSDKPTTTWEYNPVEACRQLARDLQIVEIALEQAYALLNEAAKEPLLSNDMSTKIRRLLPSKFDQSFPRPKP